MSLRNSYPKQVFADIPATSRAGAIENIGGTSCVKLLSSLGSVAAATNRKALCRDSHARPSGPLATALDMVTQEGGGS
jgi:hypothetical protein